MDVKDYFEKWRSLLTLLMKHIDQNHKNYEDELLVELINDTYKSIETIEYVLKVETKHFETKWKYLLETKLYD